MVLDVTNQSEMLQSTSNTHVSSHLAWWGYNPENTFMQAYLLCQYQIQTTEPEYLCNDFHGYITGYSPIKKKEKKKIKYSHS